MRDVPSFHAHILALLDTLPATLPWLVAFDIGALRQVADDAVLRAAWFLPPDLPLKTGAAAVLTAVGTGVVEAGATTPYHWQGAASWPARADALAETGEASLLAGFGDRLAWLGTQDPFCIGLGRGSAGGQPVAMAVQHSADDAIARAAFDTAPDTGEYELLAGCGVRFEGVERTGPYHVATFRNRLSAHLTAALASAFARTEHCNLFFFSGGTLDARLREGLVRAGEARLRVGAAMATAQAVALALAARRTPMAMTAVAPLPEPPQPMGDLVPLGLLRHALRHVGDGAAVEMKAGLDAAGQLLDRHLDARRQDGLWSFQTGRLVTATDSALVLLGRRDAAAIGALERFADGAGGYRPQLAAADPTPGHMTLTPANRHWMQADVGTTALLRALRRDAGLSETTPLAWLEQRFDDRSALYFANPFLLDWLFAEALVGDPRAAGLRQRLAEEVAAALEHDMSFGAWDPGLSTACAILALAACGRRGRLLRCAQLRLLDLVGPTGQPEAAVPFFSTLRSEPGDDVFGLVPDRPGVLRTGVLRTGGQRHDLTLYEDSHRIIGTALRARALAVACEPAFRDLPGASDRAGRHRRYACADVATYIRTIALPPYLGEPPRPADAVAA